MLGKFNPWIALGVVTVIGLAAWHYSSVIDELAAARAEAAAAVIERDAALESAAENERVTKRLQDQYQNAVAALESANAELTAASERARAAEALISSASEEDDGPVAPLLDALRHSRFSGGL